MKILILGFLAFFGWSALSTHIWVCNVKGLCNDQEVSKIYMSDNKKANDTDSIKIYSGKAKLSLPGDLTIYFEFDNYGFKADSLTERYFTESKTFLDNNSQALLTITGYTDDIGTDGYNQELGYRRAQTMQKYFIKNGMQKNKIMVSSKGENDPAGDNITVKGRANNRRAVINIKN
ncbi:MAG: OmpA family protein [Bacteroidales bacterium]|jgi:outer membrane protein OmpA-like peptidoglycan-associated protein